MVDGQNKRRTKMKEENKKKPVCMKIDADVWRQFKICAVANNFKMTDLVEKALKAEIKMMEGKTNA